MFRIGIALAAVVASPAGTSGDSASVWYVTNGLLAKELMTGEIPMSDDSIVFFTHQPGRDQRGRRR